MDLKWFLLSVLAVDNLSHILTSVDLFERFRKWVQDNFKFGKLAVCAYCQSFWLSIPVAFWLISGDLPLIAKWVIVALAMHRLANFVSEFGERYLNRAPINVFAIIKKDEDDRPKSSWFN